MNGFTFLTPWRLALLGVVVVLGIVYVVFQRRRARYAVRFTNLELLESVAPRRPGWRRHVAAAVQLVALAVLIVALAQPVHDIKVPRERATVMLALDVSLSMEATDVRPSRIEAAKSAASSFLDDVPPQVNVGLVTFAGSARIRVTPTTDRELVRAAIEDAFARILRAGKAPGFLTPDETLSRHYLDRGGLFVGVGLDGNLLTRHTAALAARFKPGVTPSVGGGTY